MWLQNIRKVVEYSTTLNFTFIRLWMQDQLRHYYNFPMRTVWWSGREPGIFSQVCGAYWGSKQPKTEVSSHFWHVATYQRWLIHTKCWVCSSWTMHKSLPVFWKYFDCPAYVWKDTRLSPALSFPANLKKCEIESTKYTKLLVYQNPLTTGFYTKPFPAWVLFRLTTEVTVLDAAIGMYMTHICTLNLFARFL